MRRVLLDTVESPAAAALAARWERDPGVVADGPAPWSVAAGDPPVRLVLWGSGSSADIDGSGRAVVDPASVRRWCEALRDVVVEHLTLVSSALVFGPATDLPVPLTESAEPAAWPLGHPARRWADIEEAVTSLAEIAGWPLAVLRPAVISGAVPGRDPLGLDSPWNPRVVPVDESDPCRQFLHVDDLVDAVAFVSDRGCEGVFHVAPQGWVRADRQRELAGKVLPRSPAATREDSVAARIDPVTRSYLEASVVVSPAALAAQGWTSAHSNEQAVIDSVAEGWWASLNARRRQEVSLAALAAAGAAMVGAGVGLARWWSRGARG